MRRGLEVLVASGLPEVPQFLEKWQGKAIWQRVAGGLFLYTTDTTEGYDLFDISTGEAAGTAAPLSAISTKVGLNQLADLPLAGLSLASIFFLAAIGLAFTFGVAM